MVQKEFSILQGGSKFIADALYSGLISKHIVFAFVAHNANVESYKCNIVLGTSYVELCVGRLIRLCLYTRMYVCLHVG